MTLCDFCKIDKPAIMPARDGRSNICYECKEVDAETKRDEAKPNKKRVMK